MLDRSVETITELQFVNITNDGRMQLFTDAANSPIVTKPLTRTSWKRRSDNERGRSSVEFQTAVIFYLLKSFHLLFQFWNLFTW